jgi:hypothetical protein
LWWDAGKLKREQQPRMVKESGQAAGGKVADKWNYPVRTTEYHKPEEERLSFPFLAGFEITLFAADYSTQLKFRMLGDRFL